MIDMEAITKTQKQRCEDQRKIVKLMPILREVIRKFDGKVYNKRFNNALCKAIEEKHGKDFWFRAELSASGEWLWVSAGINGKWSDGVSLCGCALDDGKRMNAEKLLESCNKHYAEILQECSEIECNLDRMPEIINQIAQLHTLFEQIKKQIPRSMCCSFRLDDVYKYGR